MLYAAARREVCIVKVNKVFIVHLLNVVIMISRHVAMFPGFL